MDVSDDHVENIAVAAEASDDTTTKQPEQEEPPVIGHDNNKLQLNDNAAADNVLLSFDTEVTTTPNDGNIDINESRSPMHNNESSEDLLKSYVEVKEPAVDTLQSVSDSPGDEHSEDSSRKSTDEQKASVEDSLVSLSDTPPEPSPKAVEFPAESLLDFDSPEATAFNENNQTDLLKSNGNEDNHTAAPNDLLLDFGGNEALATPSSMVEATSTEEQAEADASQLSAPSAPEEVEPIVNSAEETVEPPEETASSELVEPLLLADEVATPPVPETESTDVTIEPSEVEPAQPDKHEQLLLMDEPPLTQSVLPESEPGLVTVDTTEETAHEETASTLVETKDEPVDVILEPSQEVEPILLVDETHAPAVSEMPEAETVADATVELAETEAAPQAVSLIDIDQPPPVPESEVEAEVEPPSATSVEDFAEIEEEAIREERPAIDGESKPQTTATTLQTALRIPIIRIESATPIAHSEADDNSSAHSSPRSTSIGDEVDGKVNSEDQPPMSPSSEVSDTAHHQFSAFDEIPATPRNSEVTEPPHRASEVAIESFINDHSVDEPNAPPIPIPEFEEEEEDEEDSPPPIAPVVESPVSANNDDWGESVASPNSSDPASGSLIDSERVDSGFEHSPRPSVDIQSEPALTKDLVVEELQRQQTLAVEPEPITTTTFSEEPPSVPEISVLPVEQSLDHQVHQIGSLATFPPEITDASVEVPEPESEPPNLDFEEPPPLSNETSTVLPPVPSLDNDDQDFVLDQREKEPVKPVKSESHVNNIEPVLPQAQPVAAASPVISQPVVSDRPQTLPSAETSNQTAEHKNDVDANNRLVTDGETTGSRVSTTPDEVPDEDDRDRWLKVTGSRDFMVDLKAILPYKKFISFGGFTEKKEAIIILTAAYLPLPTEPNYNYVLNHLFHYVVNAIDLLAPDEYVVVYFHCFRSSGDMPPLAFCSSCYGQLDIRLRKSAKAIYIVHSNAWIKTASAYLSAFKQFARKKLNYVSNLAGLEAVVPTEYMFIPDEVKDADRNVGKSGGIFN